jgi:hypothetical protein
MLLTRRGLFVAGVHTAEELQRHEARKRGGLRDDGTLDLEPEEVDMIYLLVSFAACAALVGAAALLTVSAVRDEHLLMLYWTRAGTVFLEKGADGRYEGRAPWELPAVVARYAYGRLRTAMGARLQPQPARVRGHMLSHAHKA